MIAYDIKSTALPNIFYQVSSFDKTIALAITLSDEHGNFIELDKSNRQLHAQHTHGNIEPIPFSMYATDYFSYTITCKTLTVADIDAIETWQYADFIRIEYAEKPNAAVQKRMDEILKKKPDIYFTLS